MTDAKPHISQSQLNMHTRCGEQWRRRYLEKDIRPPGIALLIGSGVHTGCEVNFEQKIKSHQDLPVPDIVGAAVAGFDARMKADGWGLTDAEAGRGIEAVKGEALDTTAVLAETHAWTQAPEYQPVAVERRSRLVLPDASHDVIVITDLRDDQDRVTDFKTSKRKKSQRDADSSLQLTVEAAAHFCDTGRPCSEVRFDTLVKTKTPKRQLLSSVRTQADYQVLVARINQMLHAVKTGNFTPAPVDAWWCSATWCGYARSCKYYVQEKDTE